MGFDHDASDAEGALAVLINAIFEREREKLPTFLLELLSLYASVKTVYIDVTDVKKDLLAAGYEKEAVSVLDSITVSEQIEVKIQEEQSQEQIVRLLEEAYLAIKEENSQAAIDAYLKWHSAALLYLSSYYTEANPDYHEFKHLDNSGNGHTLRTNYKTWKT